jgi:hypothetical protein
MRGAPRRNTHPTSRTEHPVHHEDHSFHWPANHQQLTHQQATMLQRMLTRRAQMHAAMHDFMDAARECRRADIEVATINDVMQRDSRERGEGEGWAVLDGIYAVAGARLSAHLAGDHT